MNVEDLETLTITMPSGIFGSDLFQTNHTFGLTGDQLLGQTVLQVEAMTSFGFGGWPLLGGRLISGQGQLALGFSLPANQVF